MDRVKHKKNIIPFNGQRYSIWKRRVRALLDELNVLEVIDMDTPDVITEEWGQKERIAKNEIIQYLSDSFLNFAQEPDTAKDIFNHLDAIYERKSLPSQLAIRKQLLEMKLQSDTSLLNHFTTFDDYIIELLAAGAEMSETDKIAHLLLTLPSSYNGVVTALETLSEESITLAFVKTRLLDQEVKMKNENVTSLKVLHADTSVSDVRKPAKQHTKIFKPSYQRFKKSSKYKWRHSNLKCHHCGRKNHMKKDCFYYKRQFHQQGVTQGDRTHALQTVKTSEPSGSGFAFMAGKNIIQDKHTAKEITFIIDSGASDHLVNDLTVFSDVADLPSPMKINVAKNGTYILAIKRGMVPVKTNLGVEGILENVLYCPDVPYNLLSVRRIQESGMSVIFDETGGMQILNRGKMILSGKSSNDLITATFLKNTTTKVKKGICLLSYKIWHERLGHISRNKFIELRNKNMVEDINIFEKIHPENQICEACIKGKQARLPFAKMKDKSHIKRPLFIIHSDVCGPITPSTFDNKNYFVIFIDAYTHYTVTYLITYKSEVLKVFKDFTAKSKAHFNLKIVHLYCDNGREYLSNEFKDFCVTEGISYHLTVPYTPQQNSVSERMIRTITEKGRAMISDAELDKTFWGEAVLTANLFNK